MKKNRLFAILIAFFTFSCFAQNWKADHVFLIGLDGWGAYSVEKAEMPNVKTLMDAGCYTLKSTMCSQSFIIFSRISSVLISISFEGSSNKSTVTS